MDDLEKAIRRWFGNCGNEIDKDELIYVLLSLVDRIVELENKQ